MKCHKKATNQQPLLRYLGQKQGTMHDPCTQQHHGVGRPAGPPLLLPNHKPPPSSLHVRNQPALLGEQARVPSFLSSLPRAAAQVPGKPFLNFFLKDACKNHAYILEKVAQQYVLKIKSENIFLQDDKYRVLIQDGLHPLLDFYFFLLLPFFSVHSCLTCIIVCMESCLFS